LNDDEFGLLETDSDLSVFKYKHISKEEEREKADFVAQRKPLKEESLNLMKQCFKKCIRKLKKGKRQVKPFHNIEKKSLHIGNFYLLDRSDAISRKKLQI
jgi:hypothetical protein